MTNAVTYPLVSIVMPTFNRAAYIMESVESVLQQTYTNWELIIVDDGSEDNTAEIISQVSDSRVRFYKTGRTGYGIKIKNAGIEKSSGELIAFIDSDDMWVPQKLEKQIAALQQYPEAGFSITGGYNFLRGNEPLEYFYKQREGTKCGNIFFDFFRSEAAALPQTLLFGRDCLPVIHEYVKTAPSSDVDFVLGLALKFKAVILYEPLLYRRLHESSASGSNWEKGYREGIGIIRRYWQSGALPAALAIDSLFRLYMNFGNDYVKNKKRNKAIKAYFKAWQYKPFSIVPLKKTGRAILHL